MKIDHEFEETEIEPLLTAIKIKDHLKLAQICASSLKSTSNLLTYRDNIGNSAFCYSGKKF